VLTRTWRDAVFPFDALQIPPHYKGLNVITPPFIEAARHHGIQVHVWTINDPEDMARLARAGVNAIMTDLPDVLLEVLAES
jgi:glycerophosphoryl diester phosphodiesterase